VVYALAIGFLVTRRLTLRLVYQAMLQTALVTSASLLIVAMASLFAWLLTLLQVPQTVGAWIGTLTTDPVAVLVLVAIFVLICGCFIDVLPAVIILVPVLAPLADQFGIDPLHFAMTIVLNLTIGLITPPVGGVLFEIVVLALIILVPQLSTAVPFWFGYTR
jgi:TRAP-type C4-dicarboxylate transport system permease large subunit